MASIDADKVQERQQRRQDKKDKKQQPRQNTGGGGQGGARGGKGGGSAKLRGLPKDSHEVRISKTLSWVLRHGSQSEGLAMRPDGYVRVDELLSLPKLRELSFEALQEIVKNDAKGRYGLVLEADPKSGDEAWWIRANQGHSMKSIVLDLEPISSQASIPTGIAVHGTNKRAWESIKEQGLSKMSRNHIHLAQGVPSSGVLSGMRKSSDVLVYIDVQKAIDAGIKFYLSANGVVLTDGNEQGFLLPEFFTRVETASGQPLSGWQRSEGAANSPSPSKVSAEAATDGTSTPSTSVSVGVGPSKKDEAIQVAMEEMEQKVASTTL
ncbi:KptA family-domain-containing protein [Daedaleopsis nitida]|nr:KptA family-domain-containing protein [Daedaleopsis nitida]